MSLKAVFLDFSGVIIDDEAIDRSLVADILLQENLRADDDEYINYCRGRSDRAGLKDILANRGRILPDEYLDRLLASKKQAYRQEIDLLDELPLSPHLGEFLSQLKAENITVGLVTGTPKSEVEYILQKAELAQFFDIIVAEDDLEQSKPEPEPYLLALSRLNLQPSNCLAIEDNPIGIESAKRAKIQVVGIANLYPLHMLQRKANWTVDDFLEIELDRVDRVLSKT
ncbi:HAD family phosphatase [Waterburya agarophytonicola K14]|uniref:HAD family phosphatase n=1 Tax=Waterburya agarophytonicola KI4 TaxID=2874699 RepID=A0A964BXG9_9CYAN|nr:HAD family phosphatase [Waterburya agarophytonicola]MCC0179432.1 HAD family phosphatase [Waterburya agarophytonicola KI4]